MTFVINRIFVFARAHQCASNETTETAASDFVIVEENKTPPTTANVTSACLPVFSLQTAKVPKHGILWPG